MTLASTAPFKVKSSYVGRQVSRHLHMKAIPEHGLGRLRAMLSGVLGRFPTIAHNSCFSLVWFAFTLHLVGLTKPSE